MTDEENARGVEDRFKRFLKVFEDIAKATQNQTKISTVQIEIMNRMIGAISEIVSLIGHKEDGVIAAVDDLIVEVQGLRSDLREFAKGLRAVFGSSGRVRG